MILDTSFLSHLIDEVPEAWDKSTEIHEEEFEKNITSVILFELYYGARLDENSDLVRKVNNISMMYNIRRMGKDEAFEGAERLANADLAEGGESGVEFEDAMIAGVAAYYGESVLTENVDDFRKLGVEVEEFSFDR